MTHRTSDPVGSVAVVWKAPDQWAGQVVARWSVVQDYQNYWTDISSQPITISRRREPREDTSLTSIPTTTSTTAPASHPVYSACDLTKTCYGLPRECDEWRDCDLLVTWEVGLNTTTVELYRRSAEDHVYVALGLSSDDKMGGDLVTSCVSHSGRVTVSSSWNAGHTNIPMTERMTQLDLLQGSHTDGHLYCRVRLDNYIGGRPPLAGSKHFHYELDRQSYHVLLAGGEALPGGSLTYHGPRMAQSSADLLHLSRVSHVHTKFDLLLKSHGVVMVVVWLGCAGSGIILARYYKETWTDSEWCGEAQWFLWHRFLMFLVWAGTIAGVVLIVLHTGGWPYSLAFVMTNPHPILGLAALVLTFIQPLMAICRPVPASPLRWIFNWSHWFVGNCAQVIALLAIFFAIELEAAQLERMVTWVVVGWVAFHVVTHTLLSLNMCWADSGRGEVYPLSGRVTEMSRRGYQYTEHDKDKRGGGCRKLWFGLYFITTWAVVGLVVIMIWIAPVKLFDGVHHGHTH